LGDNNCLDPEGLLQKHRGRWWNRLALNLEKHLSNGRLALAVARAGLADPAVSAGDLVDLRLRAQRLWRSKQGNNCRGPNPVSALTAAADDRLDALVAQVTLLGVPSNRKAGCKSHFFSGKDNSMCSVEQLCLEHYAQPSAGSWTGVHCEGGLFLTLFALLMFDIIFAPIPGAFRHEFQEDAQT